MQYMITAYDGTDENAFNRRMDARPHHLENITKVKEYCNIINAGGILDDAGKMIGSFLIMDFNCRKTLINILRVNHILRKMYGKQLRRSHVTWLSRVTKK